MSGENGAESSFLRLVDETFSETHPGLRNILTRIYHRDSHESEFLNAVFEIAEAIEPVLKNDPSFLDVFEQLCEPERAIMFRVPWLDDSNVVRINRGYRVQFSSAIGPYKGGTRFHPSVNLSTIKMLGFEQIFKNALTMLPLGGGKGGSDFDPKSKSDGEIMRFCQSYMTELARYISGDQDVPAGDIGVGGKEIGWMYGQYKRLNYGKFEGSLTGKGIQFGGSWCRPEATGFGIVFLAKEFLKDIGIESLDNVRVSVSGSGNVARFCANKLLSEGATLVTLSDSKGTLIEPDGFTEEQLKAVHEIKKSHNGSLSEYSSKSCIYVEGARPWQCKETGSIDVAFPCATQNELDDHDVESLVAKGCQAIIEGANMPTTREGVEKVKALNVPFVPGKMANAGGVAVSGLEMAQNRSMIHWGGREVYDKLQAIMKEIYIQSKKCAAEYGVDLGSGGTIYAFLKVGGALQSQGAV